jgi:hypothetical protein
VGVSGATYAQERFLTTADALSIGDDEDYFRADAVLWGQGELYWTIRDVDSPLAFTFSAGLTSLLASANPESSSDEETWQETDELPEEGRAYPYLGFTLGYAF